MKGNHECTWVRLPYERWPQWWKDAGFKDPVCPLRLSLYGHPMSGKYWENHFTEKLESAGYEKMMGWEYRFVHRRLKFVLSVYVNDFKLAG